MEIPQTRTAKLCRESCISGSALPSLQDIYFKRCKSRAAKILKDSTHPGNHLFCLLPSGKRFRSMMAKTERLRRSFFPQAIRLLNTNPVSSTLTRLLTVKSSILSSPVLLLCVHTLNNPSAHPSYSYYYLLSPSTLFFAHLTVFCTSYCFLHILLFWTFYSIAHFTLISLFLPYICSCVVLLLYNFYFYYFALSTEWTWFDLHFTSDYTLYNLLCDE